MGHMGHSSRGSKLMGQFIDGSYMAHESQNVTHCQRWAIYPTILRGLSDPLKFKTRQRPWLANVHVRYMLSPVRLSSVCRLSVTLVHPTQAVVIFGNISTVFGT